MTNWRKIVREILRILLIYSGTLALLLIATRDSEAKSQLRIAKCEESKMTEVFVKPEFTTIINFPIRPENVVLGGKNQFTVDYIKNDIALTSLSSISRTNLFVYLLGRRCGFQLITSRQNYDNLILVRDSDEDKIKIPTK